jgi:hypothetical protein
MRIIVNDDGEPGARQDDLNVTILREPGGTDCEPPLPIEQPITKGNFTVLDR